MARNIELARLFYTLEANTKGLERDLGAAEKSLGRTAAFVAANPVVAFGALGTAALVAAGKATQMAAQFETGITRVSTLVDTTRVDMKGLSEGVLELFRSLPVKSLDDLTNGLFDIISAGVPAEQALEVLRVSAEASVGGFTDVKTVVRGVTTAINVFGKDGITAAKAADLFFTANKLGVTTIEELSSSIGNAAGIAGSLGVSLEDLLGTVTTLTTKGLDTSVAMNAVRQVLVNVAKPTAELQRDFPGLAEGFDLAALKSKGLAGFLTDLAGELKGNDTAAVKMFGSVEALGAVMALTQDGGAKLNSVMSEMNTATGAAGEAFDKAKNSTENLNQVLRNQFSAAMIELGTLILPAVNAELRGIVGLLDLLQGTAAKINLKAASATIDTLSQALNRVTGPAHAEAIERLESALNKFANASLSRFSADIKRLATDDLQRLLAGYGALLQSTELSERQTTRFQRALQLVANELATRVPAAADAAGEALAGVGDNAAATAEAAAAAAAAATAAAKTSAERAKETAARLKTLNQEIATLTIQFERGVTAARAAELLQRERDLGQSNERQVTSIREAYAEIDRLNVLLASGFDNRITPAVERTDIVVGDLVASTGDMNEVIGRAAPTLRRAADETDNLGRKMEKGARSAIDAAGAIGAIDRASQETLNTLVNLGTSIAAVFSGVGTTQGVIGIISGVGSLLKGIFGGKSPAQKAAEQVLKKNTQVLEENSRRLGDLVRLSTPGAQLASLQDVLGKFLVQFSGKPDSATSKQSTSIALGRLLAAQGIGSQDLDAIASDLGLTIKDSSGNFILGGLRQLLSVLGSIEPTQFAQTFQGQREALSREATLFDLSSAEQAQRLAALAGGQLGSSAIGARVGGLDFGTAEGRSAGLEAVRQLFRDLPGLSARDLGGLSGSDFLTVLEELKSFLESAASEAEEPLATLSDPLPVTIPDQETAPSVAETLLPAAISQEALMADLLLVNQDQLGTLQLIEQHLREAFSPVAAPLFASLAAPVRGAGAAAIPFGGTSITVNFAGGLNIDASIPGIGGLTLESLTADISAALAREILAAQQSLGSVQARLN